MQRKTEMRTTVVERKNPAVVVHNDQRTAIAAHDVHTAAFELL
jgi:hypothetical protein